MEQEILEIKELIDRLKNTDTKFRVFGADSHRYRIGPKLTESEIENFEKKHDIVLPEDYRLYLQLIGNGSGAPKDDRAGAWQRAGAGPGYGLYPLAETVRGSLVNQSFPLIEKTLVPYEPPYDAWDYEAPGALEICTSGCTSHTNLIVKGTKCGTIWEGDQYELFDPTNLSFSQWMRSWAETELQVFAKKPLVARIEIGMGKEAVIAATGEDWNERVDSGRTFLENISMRVLLELDDEKVVTKINSYY